MRIQTKHIAVLDLVANYVNKHTNYLEYILAVYFCIYRCVDVAMSHPGIVYAFYIVIYITVSLACFLAKLGLIIHILNLKETSLPVIFVGTTALYLVLTVVSYVV